MRERIPNSNSAFQIAERIPNSKFLPRPASIFDFDQRHAIHAAARQRQISVPGDRHVAHDAAAGRDGRGLKFLGLRIEAHDRVRLDAGFAVADDIVVGSESNFDDSAVEHVLDLQH